MFDEGILTSGSGKTVQCNEALFVMTANLAVDEIKKFSNKLRVSSKAAAKSSLDQFNGSKDFLSFLSSNQEKLVMEFKEHLLHGPLKVYTTTLTKNC